MASPQSADYRIFIQARMSSHRFPGKVLAPFRGAPMIAHVVARAAAAAGRERVAVVTSDDTTDDPLAGYCDARGVTVFRGPLDDVFGRFRLALQASPADWLVRISGDSPLISPELIAAIVARRAPALDLVTNVHPRSFPKGQSVEAVRAEVFAAVPANDLDAADREHVTPYFYRHADHFRILNVAAAEDWAGNAGFTVDTIDDLRRLETAPDFTPRFAPAGPMQ